MKTLLNFHDRLLTEHVLDMMKVVMDLGQVFSYERFLWFQWDVDVVERPHIRCFFVEVWNDLGSTRCAVAQHHCLWMGRRLLAMDAQVESKGADHLVLNDCEYLPRYVCGYDHQQKMIDLPATVDELLLMSNLNDLISQWPPIDATTINFPHLLEPSSTFTEFSSISHTTFLDTVEAVFSDNANHTSPHTAQTNAESELQRNNDFSDLMIDDIDGIDEEKVILPQITP